MESLPPNLPNEKLLLAVQNEAHRQHLEFLRGVTRYQSVIPKPRALRPPPVIWKQGSARLLDYGLEYGKPAVLCVPSHINRYYVLDLSQGRSFARHLAGEGIGCAILDWGDPGKSEAHFASEEYVTRYLFEAIRETVEVTGRPVTLLGYCMGGLMALAAANLYPEMIRSLALIATPWDFHAEGFPRLPLSREAGINLEAHLKQKKQLTGEEIALLFYFASPFLVFDKFRRFSSQPQNGPEERQFREIEEWVNDGVSMTAPLAIECLIDWAQENVPFRGRWRVGGKVVDPTQLNMPVFCAVPKRDRIVPPSCALPLTRMIPYAQTVMPVAGHVSMMVGHQAHQALWEPFTDWMYDFRHL